MNVAMPPNLSVPSAPPNGPTGSVAEYVRSLSPDVKHGVLLALLREAMQINGDTGLLPLEDEDGNPFGYYLPPKAVAARAEARLPKLTPEREAELTRRQTQPGPMLSEDELREWLKQATPAETP